MNPTELLQHQFASLSNQRALCINEGCPEKADALLEEIIQYSAAINVLGAAAEIKYHQSLQSEDQ